MDPSEALTFVQDPACGGTCLFVGTVRDRSDGEEVTGVTAEAWTELAERRLAEVAAEMLADARKVALLHRSGELGVGDVLVAVAASAAHREQAFAACRRGIERVKEEVPVWKKETLAGGGSGWAAGGR